MVTFRRNKVFLTLGFIEIKHSRILYLVLCNCVIKYYGHETLSLKHSLSSVIPLVYPSTLVIVDSLESRQKLDCT